MPENPDLNDDISVGVTLPFDGDQLGGYNLSKTTLQQASSNIKNLLLTMKGERPMQPTFGSDEKDRNIFKITMVFSIVGDPNRFDELTFTVEGSGD